jgi:TrmH family RNA methyltransferase
MITSIHNPTVQSVRKLLAHSKERREQGAFVIEGVRLAEEALNASWEVRLVLFTDQLDPRGQDVIAGFNSPGISVEQVSSGVMNAISDTETPQGILAVLPIKPLAIPASPNFVLILDGIRDPGNLGTIVRTAAAAGVQGALLAPGCVDAWSPKVVRAGMGAHFHLPILTLAWSELTDILSQELSNLRVFLADSGGGTPYSQADFRSPLALIVGGEAAGAGNKSLSLAGTKVHIPMPGGSESLNAAVAASILLFEVQRQRSTSYT